MTSKTMKGADIISEYLIAERVPYVLTLSGHGNVGLLDALAQRADKIRAIGVHHEQAAGHIADAYYRVAHKPLATITSCGPGSANLPIALACAFYDSSAFLAITGNVPTCQFNRGPFQETGRHHQGDFPSVIKPYVKKAFQPTRVDMVPTAIRQAFKTMLSGRPGPVNLDVPFNVFQEEGEVEFPEPSQWRWGISSRAGGDVDSLQDVLNLLLKAEKPLILAGHGVILSEASDELRQLAEYLEVPVVTTPNGSGSLDSRDALCLGPTGRNGTYQANQACRNADVLLALGTRFCDRVSSAWIPGFTFNIPPTKLIQVDIDPDEIGRNFAPAIGILGDIRSVLRQLLSMIKEEGISRQSRPGWQKEINGWRQVWEDACSPNRSSDTVPIHPERLLADLRDVFPEDGIILADAGVHHNWIVQHWPAYRPQTVIQSWGFSAMGFGVCGVIGAKLARPEKKCLSVVGDYGFMMAPHIVCTAVELNLPVIWVVWNNLAQAAIKDIQTFQFEGREIVTEYCNAATGEICSPDFVALARALGAEGSRVEHPGDLKAAFDTALKSDKPYVLEVMVDKGVRPVATGGWQLPPLPPMRPAFGS
ncbi:MAG: thiamine pyrophosphate-binding protein [Bacillota bacterium]